MKRKNHISLLIFLVLGFSVLFLFTSVFASNASNEARKEQILKKVYRVQVPFIENKGQVESKEVRFYAKTFGGTIFVEKNGSLTYSLPAKDKKGVVIKDIFTDKTVKLEGLEPSPTKVNYFIGKDKNKWKTNIQTYGNISLGEIYKGIELKLKAYGNNVEKLFTVLPKENPEEIRIKVKGSKGLKVTEEGELEVITEIGSIKFTKPIAYQETGGKRNTVEVAYALYEGNVYGFKVGDYDKNRSLTIDPLLASTFIGGSSGDYGRSIALDAGGNVYVTGSTYSSDYPTIPGSYDTNHNGLHDVFVSKLDSTLSSLLASTFIGGSDSDFGCSIALDAAGNVYVTGGTYSSDYPTIGGYDASFNGGEADVFISKLDNSLSSLLASTFIGGSSDDSGRSIALDAGGNVYVYGETLSSDYPATPDSYDTSYNGSYDVFVSKLDSTLSSLLASTFIGGSDYESNWWGNSIALDAAGNVYVTGGTWSSNYPTIPGGYDTNYNGNDDVFISKLDNSLSSLLASTFIGGSSGDYGQSIALDTGGNVYVTGETGSFDYSTTAGSYDTSYNGNGDVFVSKLDSNLSSLLASTFIGGNRDDYGRSIALDGSGNVYVTGETYSSDYPAIPSSYDPTHNGLQDVFVSKLDSTLSSLLAGTFIGGSEFEESWSIALDASGNVYVTGNTSSSDYPSTPGAYDTSYNGIDDVFVSKLDSNLSEYGDTWTPTENLSNNAGDSAYPVIAVSGSNIYVVWYDNTLGDFEIYFKKSDDGGTTWKTTENLSNNAGFAVDPAIAVDGQNIYVVWQNYTPGIDKSDEIYFKKSDDGGATWTANKKLTNNSVSSLGPAIAVDGSNIYVVWFDFPPWHDYAPGNYEIYLKHSDDGGVTWTTKRLTWNTGTSVIPAIAVDGSNIYVVWMDSSPGNYDIYFKQSSDGGTTWPTRKRLTGDVGYSWSPAIAVDGQNIYVVWQDYRPGNYEIYFKQSSDGGATWPDRKRLTGNAGNSEFPAIAVDGSNIYVVWMDSSPGNYDIYFKQSSDGGATWPARKRLTGNAGDSCYPAIAVDGSNIYVVWMDITSGNFEIYFKKGILN